MTLSRNLTGWLYVSPLLVVLVPFFLAPIGVVAIASFFESDGFGGFIYELTFENYIGVLTSDLTLRLYLSAFKFAALTWIFTALLGFWIAYFLVFHVRSQLLAIGLFLICTVPFWTSTIIRMISWIPLLGKEGLINSGLQGVGVIDQPLEFLLFSDFAVVVAYVHQLTIFMIVPLFNSMSRIDPRLIEAARDNGATRWDVVRLVVLPLTRSGLALGSIFVLSIVMGDFLVVRVMSGGGSASIVGALYEDITVLQYPPAAAAAVVLTVAVMAVIVLILRTVDIRKELAR
ncbi:MAG: ABC transporter permease [Minwuia sp.]|uniref:ABC transporter permease n=1 Tax=Minwuia sp. TaxID=2493630 RepID=UPI003A8B04B5